MPKALFANPADLLPNPWNTNVMSPASEQKLDNSLRRFGCFKPVVVREISGPSAVGLRDVVTRFEIIGGEHRAQSAVRVGLAQVPIMNLGPISDQEAKEISLADNARYGADDTLALAELLKNMGNSEELQDFLPFSDTDIASIFSASDIDLSELDLAEDFDAKDDTLDPEPPAAKVPKTHTIMRFKVLLGDAETITARIAQTQSEHGYTAADELTNAGDALVHLLLMSEPEG